MATQVTMIIALLFMVMCQTVLFVFVAAKDSPDDMHAPEIEADPNHHPYWDGLSEYSKLAATVLGYDQKKWDDEDYVHLPIFDKTLDELTDEERSASSLLWLDQYFKQDDKNPPKVGDEIEKDPHHHPSWDDLSEYSRMAATVIGYDKASWDSSTTTLPIYEKTLDELTDEEREVASFLWLHKFFKQTEQPCALFLGPSPIKEAEQHGFGLGLFTGVDIPEDTLLEPDEVLIPIYDSVTLDSNHPPLREYLWGGAEMPEIPLGSSNRNAYLFNPGLGGIAACTSTNFNVQLSGSGSYASVSRKNVAEDENIPPRTSPLAGSYSYRHSVSYVTTRDIVAGEELVVECADDDFDGSSHRLSRFDREDTRFICVDNVIPGDSTDPSIIGKGLLAKRKVVQGDNIISTPVIPIHRRELFGDGTGSTAPAGVNSYQLLLNYAFGHIDSDLLLLPYGPLVSYINHAPANKKANAVIKWHPLDKNRNNNVPKRQQHHHPELLDLPADVVAETHGKGLMIDIVALCDIDVGEEIYIDYGDAWTEAWEDHVKRWKPPADAASYMSADQYFHANDFTLVKTIAELEKEPYPDNIQTVCYYDGDATVLKVDQENNIVYTTWVTNDFPHECMRPCKILDRYYDEESKETLYKAEMIPIEGAFGFCKLSGGTHIASDVPWDAILIVDKENTHDEFLEQAFRHEIGVPEGFYPRNWLRQKVRRRPDTQSSASNEGIEFKRKTKKVVAARWKERSPRIEL